MIVVRFHEVDAYNVVHNVHYFNFFDVGRFSMVDHFLRRERPPVMGSYFFMVLKSGCKYLTPARMADELVIETRMQYSPDRQNAKIDLSHTIVKKHNNMPIVEGSTILGICNEKLELLYRIPNDIREYLDEQIAYYQENPDPSLKILKV